MMFGPMVPEAACCPCVPAVLFAARLCRALFSVTRLRSLNDPRGPTEKTVCYCPKLALHIDFFDKGQILFRTVLGQAASGTLYRGCHFCLSKFISTPCASQTLIIIFHLS